MGKGVVICVVGPIAAGKTTLATRLSDGLDIPYLTETMFDGGLMGMLDHLGDCDRVILEHANLLNFYEQIAERFAFISVVYIDISEELMGSHNQQRIAAGSTGDFMWVDPIQMKRDIEQAVSVLPEETSLWVMHIGADTDYSVETKRIVRGLRTVLQSAT